MMTARDDKTAMSRTWASKPPLAMLAELTHRCPLQCPYCSNPLDLARRSDELSAETWCDVFRQAVDIGVLQVHLSGGGRRRAVTCDASSPARGGRVSIPT